MKGNHLANEAENNYYIVVFSIILLVWLSLSLAFPFLQITVPQAELWLVLAI